MEKLAAGQVVLLRFPFSDLSGTKLRPGLLLASCGNDDWIVCQITSNPYAQKSIEVRSADFTSGGLPHTSYVRPAKLVTLHNSVIAGVLGRVSADMLAEARGRAAQFLFEQ